LNQATNQSQEIYVKIKQLPKKIAGLMFGFTLLLGIGIGSSTTVNAQDRNGDGYQDRRDRNWDRYGNYGGSVELRQTALNAGYNEGVREGINDRQNNRRSSYQNSNAYQRATKDYSRNLGDRDLYRRYFREAFVNGYNVNDQSRYGRDGRDGNRDRNDNTGQDRRGRNWERYGSYGGSYELRQTALNAGYNEAIKQGRTDRQRGRYSDFRNFGAFQKATQDYSSKLGDRELYRRYYREGFENGYTDGYNGG
jgi:hypothetical protein